MNDLQATDAKPELLHSADERISIVVVPSQRCFVVPLEIGEKFRSEDELRFELESHVLIDAESIVHCTQFSNTHAIAVVADGEVIRSSLTDSQFAKTIAVCPKALLVVEGIINRSQHDSTKGSGCFIVVESNHIDAVLIGDHKLQQWRFCSTQRITDVVGELLRDDSGESIARVCIVGSSALRDLTEKICKSLEAAIENAHASVTIELCKESSEVLLHEAAKQVLEGRRLPLVGLQGSCLKEVDARRPAFAYGLSLVASILLLGFCLIGGMYLRASRYHAETEVLVEKQEALFKQVFPKQKIPVGMMSRFQSEHRRLRVTKGTQSRPTIPNSLEVFHALLNALPDSADQCRFQIQSLRLEQKTVSSLVGRVESLEALDQFRQSISAAGFSLPPVASRPDAQGVPINWTSVTWSPPKEDNSANRPQIGETSHLERPQ